MNHKGTLSYNLRKCHLCPYAQQFLVQFYLKLISPINVITELSHNTLFNKNLFSCAILQMGGTASYGLLGTQFHVCLV
jgi:hypothetical protein